MAKAAVTFRKSGEGVSGMVLGGGGATEAHKLTKASLWPLLAALNALIPAGVIR